MFGFGRSVVTTHNHLLRCHSELVAIGMAVGLVGCMEPVEWVHPIHCPSNLWFRVAVLAVSVVCSQADVRLLGQIYRAWETNQQSSRMCGEQHADRPNTQCTRSASTYQITLNIATKPKENLWGRST